MSEWPGSAILSCSQNSTNISWKILTPGQILTPQLYLQQLLGLLQHQHPRPTIPIYTSRNLSGCCNIDIHVQPSQLFMFPSNLNTTQPEVRGSSVSTPFTQTRSKTKTKIKLKDKDNDKDQDEKQRQRLEGGVFHHRLLIPALSLPQAVQKHNFSCSRPFRPIW